jgi:hypothetical protein
MNELPGAPRRPVHASRRVDPRIVGVSLLGSVAILLAVLALLAARGDDQPLAAASPSSAPSESAPLPSASTDPSPSPSPAATNGVPPTPAARQTPGVAGRPSPYPVDGSADPPLIVAGPDGGVYAAVRDGGSIVVGLFARDGSVRPGWPVHLKTQWCTQLVAADDGSLRAACAPWQSGSEGDGGLEAPVMRIFAIDSRGHSLPGWPVDLESGSMIETIGNDVLAVVRPYGGDTLPDGEAEPAVFARIGRDGSVRMGTHEVPLSCCESSTAIGPTQAYVVARRGYDGDPKSDLTAFGLDGAEWTVTMDGIASDPAFDARGNVHVSVWLRDPSRSRALVFDANGSLLPTSSDELPISPSNGASGAGPEWPGAPTVAADGSRFLIEDSGRTSILAIDEGGNPRRGWPYQAAQGIGYVGECPRGDTGCGLPMVRPAVGPDGTLYVALSAGSDSTGSSMIALSPGGKVRSGWPVGLTRPGGQFWGIVAGSDGGVWTLAAEPDKHGYDATLLSIAPDSTIRGKVTIVEAAIIGP